MPNLNDIVEMAEALGTKYVLVAEERCVAVRNRNAKCTKCVDACSQDAIKVGGNKLTLDPKRCVGCGACTSACPTESLIPLQPLDEELAQATADAVVAAEGIAVFACARIASKRLADPQKFAEVPCLARMEESLLLSLVAHGATRVVLVDGTCATCKYHACSPGVDAMVASANALLDAVGSPVAVERASAFPEELLVEYSASVFGVSRRDFFSQARNSAKDTAKKAAMAAIEKEFGTKKPTSLRERLGIQKGSMPKFSAARRLHALDAMDRIGAPVLPEATSRLFGSVAIDIEKCTSCSMCTTFCPTGALRKSDVEPEGEDDYGSFLEFSAADCVQCRACEDICLKRCLTVSPTVSTEELFDFEPRMIYLPEPPAKAGILGGRNKRRKKK